MLSNFGYYVKCYLSKKYPAGAGHFKQNPGITGDFVLLNFIFISQIQIFIFYPDPVIRTKCVNHLIGGCLA